MSGIGVEESAAIGADVLDGLERGDRAERNRLLAALRRVSRYLGIESLGKPCQIRTSDSTKLIGRSTRVVKRTKSR